MRKSYFLLGIFICFLIISGCGRETTQTQQDNTPGKQNTTLNAQALEGPEIPISEQEGEQQNPRIIYLPDKRLYFVVWEDWRNVTHADIYGKFLQEDGTPCGAEFRIDGDTAGIDNQTFPDVAYRIGDKLLVVWQDTRGNPNGGYIYYRSITLPATIDCANFNPTSALGAETPVGFNPVEEYTSPTTTAPVASDGLLTRYKPKVVYDKANDRFLLAWIEVRAINKRVSQVCFSATNPAIVNEQFGNNVYVGYMFLDGATLNPQQSLLGITGADILRNARTLSVRGLSQTLLALQGIYEYEYFVSPDNVDISCDPTTGVCAFVFQGIRYRLTLTCECTDTNGNNICDSGELVFGSISSTPLEDGNTHIYALMTTQVTINNESFWVDEGNPDSAFLPAVENDPVSKRFLVVWEDLRDGPLYTKIYGQLLSQSDLYNRRNFIVSYQDADGDGQNDPEVANSRQTRPDIIYDDVNQRYFVIWQDARNQRVSEENLDIYGQFVDPEGSLRGSNFFISIHPANQLSPAGAYNPNLNQFFAVWKDARNTQTTGSDIYGQRFTLGQGNLTILDENGNRVLYPAVIDFGLVQAGNVSTKSFIIKNTGNENLNLDCIVFEGGVAEFTFDPALPAKLSSCGDGQSETLTIGNSFTVRVKFSPTTSGIFNDTIRIESDGGIKRIIVQGASADLTAGGLQTQESDGSNDGILDFGSIKKGESLTHAVIVTNNTGTNVTITSVQASNSGVFSVGTAPPTPTTLQPNTNLTVYVTVDTANLSRGDYSGYLYINTDIPGTERVLTLRAKVTAPILRVSTQSLDFGQVAVGSSADLSITVFNDGDADMNIASCGTPPLGFSVVACPTSVPAGSSATITYRFSPTDIQAYNGTITIETDAGSQDITLTGQGRGAKIEVSPTVIDFGYVLVNSSSSVSITITNTGNEPLTISNINTSSLGASFSLVYTGNFPITIQPGTSFNIVAEFTPSLEGLFGGSFTIESDAINGNISVSLQGFGLNVEIDIPTSIDFGSVKVNDSLSKLLTISNKSSKRVTILNIDSPSAPFGLTTVPTLPRTLGPGEEVSLVISFTPQEAGTYSSVVGILFDFSETPFLVSLSGTATSLGGTLGSALTFEYNNSQISVLNFGKILIGETGIRTITLNNTSLSDIQIVEVQVGAPFRVVETSFAIPANSRKTLDIFFEPANTGLFNAQLNLKDAQGNIYTLSLSGEGTDIAISAQSTNVNVSFSRQIRFTSYPPGIIPKTGVSFVVTGVNGNVDLEIKLAETPQGNVKVYKYVNGNWKEIYPNNKCRGINNVNFANNVISFSIQDNSECDLDQTPGKIIDPILIGVESTVTTSPGQGEVELPPSISGSAGCSVSGNTKDLSFILYVLVIIGAYIRSMIAKRIKGFFG